MEIRAWEAPEELEELVADLPGERRRRRGTAGCPERPPAARHLARLDDRAFGTADPLWDTSQIRSTHRNMPTKRQILDELKRDELTAAVDRFELPVADRRVKVLLIEALASSQGAALAEILGELRRDRLKELCRALGVDDGGREKAAIIDRLVDETRESGPATASVEASVTPPDLAEAVAPPAPSATGSPPLPQAGAERRPSWTAARSAPGSYPRAPDQPRLPSQVRTGQRPGAAPPGRPQGRPEGSPRRKKIDIQDPFLFQNLRDGRRVVFALVTGQFIEGRIQRFDQYSVLVDADGKTLLIFKSAISDISLPLGPP